MRRSVSFVAVVLIALTATFVISQDTPPTNPDRRVLSRVIPTYPELAKKMHIHGMVRLEAVVRTNGTVKSTRVLGGSPVLVNAAVDAVSKWKYEPAQGETSQLIQLTFEDQ